VLSFQAGIPEDPRRERTRALSRVTGRHIAYKIIRITYTSVGFTYLQGNQSGIAHIQKRKSFWPNKGKEAEGTF
jgi:hypothetical protein